MRFFKCFLQVLSLDKHTANVSSAQEKSAEGGILTTGYQKRMDLNWIQMGPDWRVG